MTTIGNYQLDEGVLKIQVHIDDTDEFDMEDAKYHVRTCLGLCEGIKRPFLIDARDINGIVSLEVMKHMAGADSLEKLTTAKAYIVSKYAIKLLTNFYVNLIKHSYPIRIFENEEEAIRWLGDFK